MSTKERLSASVDSDLMRAGRRAVASGSAPNLSSWINKALARQVEHDQRIASLGEFIAAYEQEHGEITEPEMAAAYRRAHSRAVVVRGLSDGNAMPLRVAETPD